MRTPPMTRSFGRPDGQSESGFRGSLGFLNIYPKKPESACFITVLSSSNILWKKVNSDSLLHMRKGMFQLKPL